jgi:hypothetical protein
VKKWGASHRKLSEEGDDRHRCQIAARGVRSTDGRRKQGSDARTKSREIGDVGQADETFCRSNVYTFLTPVDFCTMSRRCPRVSFAPFVLGREHAKDEEGHQRNANQVAACGDTRISRARAGDATEQDDGQQG